MKNLETRNYKLAVSQGTFIIIRKSDDTTTLRFVCSEGEAEYKKLSRAHRAKRGAFDAVCAKYEYTA